MLAGRLGLAATSGGKREEVPGSGDALGGWLSPHERKGSGAQHNTRTWASAPLSGRGRRRRHKLASANRCQASGIPLS